MRSLPLVAALVLLAPAALAAETTAGAHALEARLLAPCCWGSTLDIHDSDLARSLRTEIETRVANHESAESIQEDMVARYGDRVLAARSDAPIRAMGIALALVAALAAIVFGLVLRRWTRAKAASPAPAAGAAPDALDARIDDALAELD